MKEFVMEDGEIIGTVSRVISEIGDIPLEEIKMDSNIIEDLGIDSLAFLDITFELDQYFDIKIPVETWMEHVNQGQAKQEDFFTVRQLCDHINRLVTDKAA